MNEPYVARIAALHRELGIAPGSVRLPLQEEVASTALVAPAAGMSRAGLWLESRTAVAWLALHTAATHAGVGLELVSGFRSVARQREIIDAQLAQGRPLSDILRWIAPPGHSEHHTGRAIDLGTPGEPPLEETFACTIAFDWLLRHAGGFGFSLSYPQENAFGVGFEPWHWCWHPRSK